VPTYQYACTDCGERLEAVQKFSDDPLTVCRACGGKLRKVFSPVGIVFKGSGFYRTDSRAESKSSEPALAKSNGSSDGKKSESGASSSDSSGSSSTSGSSGSSGDKSGGASGKKSGDKVGSSPASSSGSKVA
jgi:putative FmdB family regulatory protein